MRHETLHADLYETPHRLAESLDDMRAVLVRRGVAVLARNSPNNSETVRAAPLGELVAWVSGRDDNQQLRRGV